MKKRHLSGGAMMELVDFNAESKPRIKTCGQGLRVYLNYKPHN